MKKEFILINKLSPAFSDSRGLIYDILESKVEHIGMVTFDKKGVVRGNHYHKKSIQYTLLLEGKIKLSVCKKNSNEIKTYILNKGDFTKIPANVVHTYESLKKSVILDMTTLSRKANGYEEDTVRI